MATATDGVGTVQAEQSKVWEWLTTVDHKKKLGRCMESLVSPIF
jgi:hypothetical protein